MNVQSKEFWLKVKEEYRPDLAALICYTSNEFRIAWDREVSYNFIVQEALKFLKDDRFEVTFDVLFFLSICTQRRKSSNPKRFHRPHDKQILMISIFKTSFTQVLLISVNTIFLSKGNYIGVAICSFSISYLWVTNVKKANISSKAEQLIYALGATFGGLSGLLITKLI